jgi:hypothetical protein
MWQVRQLFDAVIDEFPDLKVYISKKADIIHSEHFENAVVKIQGNLTVIVV